MNLTEKERQTIVNYLCWSSKYVPYDVKASKSWQKRVNKTIQSLGVK